MHETHEGILCSWSFDYVSVISCELVVPASADYLKPPSVFSVVKLRSKTNQRQHER